jgi:ATP-dependent Clp protease adaptor protein ClpS
MSVRAAVAEPVEERREEDRRRPKHQPRYQVILWNDDDHTFEYVIAMLAQLFGFPIEKGFQLALEVDTRGRAVVLTTTREHAELKRDQIHAFGRDGLMQSSQGSMSASIEPLD